MRITHQSTPAELAFRETFLAHIGEPRHARTVREFGDLLFTWIFEADMLLPNHCPPDWTLLLPALATDLDSIATELSSQSTDFARAKRKDPANHQAGEDAAKLRRFAARARTLARDINATAQQWLREDEEGEQPAAEPEQGGVGVTQ